MKKEELTKKWNKKIRDLKATRKNSHNSILNAHIDTMIKTLKICIADLQDIE